VSCMHRSLTTVCWLGARPVLWLHYGFTSGACSVCVCMNGCVCAGWLGARLVLWLDYTFTSGVCIVCVCVFVRCVCMQQVQLTSKLHGRSCVPQPHTSAAHACVCVCSHMDLCTHTHIHTHTNTYTHTHTYTHRFCPLAAAVPHRAKLAMDLVAAITAAQVCVCVCLCLCEYV
jgi:hypothetical protein